MVFTPDGLSPDFNSTVSPDVSSSLVFSWNYIPINNEDFQESATIKVFKKGSNTSVIQKSVEEDEEVDISNDTSKLTLNTDYEWEVTVKSSNGQTASSGRKPFRYERIVFSADLEWPDGPVPYEYIGTRRYFNEIRENTIAVLKDYVVDTTEEESALAKANVLFSGQIVPARDDFKSLEDILALIAEKESTYRSEIIQLIKDGLGAEDIHKVYEIINRLVSMPPIDPSNMLVNIENVVPLRIASGTAKNSGIEGAKVNVNWKPTAIEKPIASIKINSDLSEDTAYYRLDVDTGFSDYKVGHSELIFSINQLKRLGREIKVVMNHALFHPKSSSKTTECDVYIRAVDKRRQESPVFSLTRKSSNVPVDVDKYQLRVKRNDIRDKTTVTGYKRIYEGSKTSYIHTLSKNAEGVYHYQVRVFDVNGKVSPYYTIPGGVKFDPLKPPGPPKPKVTNITQTKFTVSWPSVPNAEKYEINPAWSSAVWSQTSVKRVIGNKTALKPNTTYKFKVRAVNRAGASKWVSVSAKTKPKPKVTKTEKGVTSRVWRGTSTIKLQRGPTVKGAPWYYTSVDNKEVFHGEWIELRNKYESGYYVRAGTSWGKSRSYLFLNHASWRKTLKGKKITKVQVYIKRNPSAHGYPNDGRILHIYTHNYASKSKLPKNPSTTPKLANKFTADKMNWKRGEGKWVTLPNKYGEWLRDNKIKGFAFYHPDSHKKPYQYMRLNVSSFRLKITYQ